MPRARRTLLALAVVGLLSPGRAGAESCALRDVASAAGVFIGAGFVEGSHDATFREVLAREYNGVTTRTPACS